MVNGETTENPWAKGGRNTVPNQVMERNGTGICMHIDNMYTYKYTCIYVCIRMCKYIYIHAYMYMCVCIVYIVVYTYSIY